MKISLLIILLGQIGLAMTESQLTRRLPSEQCSGKSRYKKLKQGFIQYCRNSADGTQRILLRGNILEGDESHIDSILMDISKSSKKTVLITDGALGGLISEHEKLAKAVEKVCKSKTQKCESKMIGKCASACNMLHAGIKKTMAGPDAENCFHSASVKDGNGKKKLVKGAEESLKKRQFKKDNCLDVMSNMAVFKKDKLTCVKPEVMIAAGCVFVSEIDPELATQNRSKPGGSSQLDASVERKLRQLADSGKGFR